MKNLRQTSNAEKNGAVKPISPKRWKQKSMDRKKIEWARLKSNAGCGFFQEAHKISVHHE